jgi:DNA repair photolyase
MPAIRGRGASDNPRNRFDRIERTTEEPEPGPRTVFLRDSAKSVVATNDSPDVGFEASLNPYRGCEHGCVYCYARPTHEFLGFSAGLDFETKILVKEEAPGLLRTELESKRWKPKVLALSGVTDPYQPAERRFGLTRSCLRVLAEFRNPVVIVTKNDLVTRDADLLAELARHRAAAVYLSIPTLNLPLSRILEPRTSPPERRLQAVRELSSAGIPTGVLVAPIIPGLTEHELPSILKTAAEAGASFAGHTVLRLPLAVAPLFERWLDEHMPDRKARILNRIREMRGGRLNDPRFGSRMRGEGIFARQIQDLVRAGRRKAGLAAAAPELSTAAFRRPSIQRELWNS